MPRDRGARPPSTAFNRRAIFFALLRSQVCRCFLVGGFRVAATFADDQHTWQTRAAHDGACHRLAHARRELHLGARIACRDIEQSELAFDGRFEPVDAAGAIRLFRA